MVVSGPSGVGKSTIDRAVRQRAGVVFSVSATTRPPREGEVDGREYHFVDRRAFQEMIRRGELLEWAEVFGECYGTPAGPVRQALREGKTVLLEIDVQGAMQVHQQMPEATFVLILPPSRADLRRRLSERATEDLPAVRRRLAEAEKEMRVAEDSGVYDYVVVNDDLERAVEQLTEIVTRE